MQRRDFLKASCQLCLLGSAGFLLAQLSSCSPAAGSAIYKTDVINNHLEVPLSLFDKPGTQFVRPKGWNYDIAVQKNNDNYQALLLQCTHQNNQLTATGNGFLCSLHGSEFDKNGNVKKGPAEEPLKKYRTSVNQNNLIIYI